MKKKLDKALEGQIIPAAVHMPPALRDGKLVTTYEGYDQVKKASIDQQRLRIQVDCDPLGTLIAMAQGLPIPSVHVEVDEKNPEAEPKVVIKYETVDLKTRIGLLTAMLDKMLPNASVTESVKPSKGEPNGKDDHWNELTRKRSAAVLEGESG